MQLLSECYLGLDRPVADLGLHQGRDVEVQRPVHAT